MQKEPQNISSPDVKNFSPAQENVTDTNSKRALEHKVYTTVKHQGNHVGDITIGDGDIGGHEAISDSSKANTISDKVTKKILSQEGLGPLHTAETAAVERIAKQAAMEKLAKISLGKIQGTAVNKLTMAAAYIPVAIKLGVTMLKNNVIFSGEAKTGEEVTLKDTIAKVKANIYEKDF